MVTRPVAWKLASPLLKEAHLSATIAFGLEPGDVIEVRREETNELQAVYLVDENLCAVELPISAVC